VEDCAAVKVGVERHGKNIWRRDSVVAPGRLAMAWFGWLLVAAAAGRCRYFS
jgi:hypothetical protein